MENVLKGKPAGGTFDANKDRPFEERTDYKTVAGVRFGNVHLLVH